MATPTPTAAVIPTPSPIPSPTPSPTPARGRPTAHRPDLWRTAAANRLAFGTSTATWQFGDAAYLRLLDAQAATVITEDDLLWYRVRPTPTSGLDFSCADRFYRRAHRHGQRVIGAHLVWDQGFGDGWNDDDLRSLDRRTAHRLLFGTLEATVRRYRDRTVAWIVANEVTDPEGRHGLRTDVPWYDTLGSGYVAEAFHRTRAIDRSAVLVLNEFGFETTNRYGDDPVARQRATLAVIDNLLAHDVPVDALGIQGHLIAEEFATRFDRRQYAHFLAEVTGRGLRILVTELDVLDDGLPASVAVRDQAVAEVYRRYLDAVLDQPAVTAVLAFGLTDRYTWLQEDDPRDDGADRRPLAFDDGLRTKPATATISRALAEARARRPLWPRDAQTSRMGLRR